MKIKLILSASLLLLATSCISVQKTQSQHVYTNTKLTEVKSEGKACSHQILFFWFGDMTVDSAAKSAGITEVAFVENKTETYPFYAKHCTIVKGK